MRTPEIRALTRELAAGLDAAARAGGFSRAAVGRRAGLDASTLWRAVHRGEARARTMVDFSEAVAGMQAQGAEEELGLRGHVRAVCAWIGDRRGEAEVPEASITALRRAAGPAGYDKVEEPALTLFATLASARAWGGRIEPGEQILIAALGLYLMEAGA